MKKTTFSITNNTKNNTTHFPNANYSEILDTIISTNLIETNSYLKEIAEKKKNETFIDNLLNATKKAHSCIFGSTEASDEFTKAALFLTNYGKKKNAKMPFILGKTYKLIDGTPIIFYSDEIQIGFDLYSYSDFGDTLFLKKLTPSTKKTIIDIYTTGNTNINININ